MCACVRAYVCVSMCVILSVTAFVLVTVPVPVSYTRSCDQESLSANNCVRVLFHAWNRICVCICARYNVRVCACVCDRSRQIGTPLLKIELSEKLWSTIVCQL